MIQHVKIPHLDKCTAMAVESVTQCHQAFATFMQLCTCLRYLRENT